MKFKLNCYLFASPYQENIFVFLTCMDRNLYHPYSSYFLGKHKINVTLEEAKRMFSESYCQTFSYDFARKYFRKILPKKWDDLITRLKTSEGSI